MPPNNRSRFLLPPLHQSPLAAKECDNVQRFTLAGAAHNRNFVAQRMTPQQIAAGDELVRAWQAKPEK